MDLYEFKVSLNYIVRPCLDDKKDKKIKNLPHMYTHRSINKK